MLSKSLFKQARSVNVNPVLGRIGSNGGVNLESTRYISRKSFATSSSIDNDADYEIDLISLRKTKKNDLSTKPIAKSTVLKSINEIKSDPLDFKAYRRSDEQGYLEFVQNYKIELTEFLNFIRKSYNNKIKDFKQLTPVELSNSALIFKNLFLKGKLNPTINKYNSSSYQKMITRLLKYTTHDDKFHINLSDSLLPFVNSDVDLTLIYSKGILNYLPELKDLFGYKKLTGIDQVISEVNNQINILNESLMKSKELENYDLVFFKNFINLQRYSNLNEILSSCDLSTSDLEFILNDSDNLIINNRIKYNSGEDSKIYSTLLELNGHINFFILSSAKKFENFPQFLEELYNASSNSNDLISKEIYSTIVEKLLPLLCNSTINISDIEILKPVVNEEYSKDTLIISDNNRVNFELKTSELVGLHDCIGLLNHFKNYIGGSLNISPIKIESHLVSYINEYTDPKVCSPIVLSKLEDFQLSLREYLSIINWKSNTLDSLLSNQAWQAALDWYSGRHYQIDDDMMAVYDYTDYIKNFEPKDVKYDELLVNLQQEIKLLKSNQLNNLPFECFKVDEIKSILSNLLPSSTRLNQLKNSLPASGSNAKFLDQVLLSPPPAPPSQSYTQVPDDLELDKFINELTILKKDVLKKPYKSFTSSALNKFIDEKIDEVFNSKFHGPKIFKPVNSTEFGIHRGNVYQFVRLSKRLTRLFEVNGGNTEVLDFLIHSQSVFNDMEAKIREKKLAKLATKATTKENDKPYVQIPDDLELHKFTKELEIFKNDELRSSFKNFSPDKINSLLDKRINEIYNDLPNTNPASRLSKENVFEFMRLSKRITRLFDMNGGNTQVLDSVIQSQSVLDSVEAKIAQKKKEKELKASKRDTYETKPYTQIPDDLELHNFINELEILKNDELKASFGNFSAEKINSLLDKRINEIYNDLPNTNPVSRLSKENIYGFMRLSKRLTRLFNINNGNTAILDTLLKNQSILNNVERKIAEKNVSEKPTVKPYVQIPDDLELHKFTKELEIFKNDELKSSFKNFSPDKINALLDKRINEIYNDLPNTNLASRLSKDNVYDFMRLSKRLTRLFDVNGGHTGVLDTLLQSQSVFDNVDSMIKKRRLSSTNISAVPASPLPYKQVPDDFMLEEYMVDLLQLRSELGDDFKKFETDKIMQQLRNMIDNVKKYNLDKRITFSKLYRNLSLLFKHNGQQSFILDNVLINAQTYSDFESSLANRRLNNTIETQPEELSKPKESKDRLQIPTDEEYTNKFNMEEFINNPPNKKTQYNDSEYLISLLAKNGEPSELDNEDLLKSELAFKDAVSNALNNKASKSEENPEEFDELVNLTAEKVRENYKNKSKPEKEVGEKKANVDKETLQDFLQNAKKENELAKERRFRESKAYEWSKSLCNSNRTLESHNFFNPLLSISKSKDSEDLLFPDANKINRNGERKYLILTPNGSKVVMNENPFGPYHADEDIFSVLNKFSEDDFKRLCKVIKRYQSKNWKLIGGGGKEKILVFTRVKFDKKKFVLTKLKTAFATAGVVFITLFGLNYWSGNLDHVQRNERITPPPPNPAEETKVPQSASSMANKTNEANGASEKPLWSGLFWK